MSVNNQCDNSKRYIIRQARADDIEVLDKIHAENMQNYVEEVYLLYFILDKLDLV